MVSQLHSTSSGLGNSAIHTQTHTHTHVVCADACVCSANKVFRTTGEWSTHTYSPITSLLLEVSSKYRLFCVNVRFLYPKRKPRLSKEKEKTQICLPLFNVALFIKETRAQRNRKFTLCPESCDVILPLRPLHLEVGERLSFRV